MVMQAQQPQQGMSISDILSMAQLAKQGQQTGINTPVEQQNMPDMTYTKESGSPVVNGTNVPVPPTKPEEIQKPEGSSSLSSILDTLKNSTLGGWLVNKLGG